LATGVPKKRRGWWRVGSGRPTGSLHRRHSRNTAITIARSLTDTFAGIRAIDAPAFIAAQVFGAIAALGVGRLIFPAAKPTTISYGFETATPSTDDKRPEASHV